LSALAYASSQIGIAVVGSVGTGRVLVCWLSYDIDIQFGNALSGIGDVVGFEPEGVCEETVLEKEWRWVLNEDDDDNVGLSEKLEVVEFVKTSMAKAIENINARAGFLKANTMVVSDFERRWRNEDQKQERSSLNNTLIISIKYGICSHFLEILICARGRLPGMCG
jgi:hypothetical protein